jgi:hypothetical protein
MRLALGAWAGCKRHYHRSNGVSHEDEGCGDEVTDEVHTISFLELGGYRQVTAVTIANLTHKRSHPLRRLDDAGRSLVLLQPRRNPALRLVS